MQLNNEISVKGKGISPALERKKDEIKFPKFNPSKASFAVDPPNIIPKKAYKRRKGNGKFVSFFFLACCQYIHFNGNPFGSS